MKKTFVVILSCVFLLTNCMQQEKQEKKKPSPKNAYSGLYIPQESVATLGNDNWVVIIIDTDFDLIPETAFIAKLSTYNELNNHCGKDSVALVYGIKENIRIEGDDGERHITNHASKPQQKPVVTTILEYREKPKKKTYSIFKYY